MNFRDLKPFILTFVGAYSCTPLRARIPSPAYPTKRPEA
jgi:hypothetical protein